MLNEYTIQKVKKQTNIGQDFWPQSVLSKQSKPLKRENLSIKDNLG